MVAHELSHFSGWRHHKRYRCVTRCDGCRVMNSDLAEFDWGLEAAPSFRRVLARGLLLHAGYAGAAEREELVSAFAGEVVARFPQRGFTIFRADIAGWLADYYERQAGR